MSRQTPVPPRIVVTVAVAARQSEPEIAARKDALYAASVTRHGGEPIVLDATSDAATRAAAFAGMDGLLLTGGADLHPERYGQPSRGSITMEPDRDALEHEAWTVAQARGVPVLGLCRGFQAINAFSGGTLLQHVDGHQGPRWGAGPAKVHPLRVAPGTRLARILFPTNAGGGVLRVNTYHHQAVRPSDLAPGLVANAWASSPAGDLIEGLEASDGRFIFGVQCHPERTESTPPAFERLFSVFVDAARGPADRR
ncbi:MAG TPA: gamma-glutamyl-gamma-aminobutyrate hydrolase family protein [Candidatus Limnocylindrales bacterium]|jgi:putative glutamine amidotransferase|nr:gamma-glutamyl-gamma-aminobutyrate hydrolase family protein [Candidatus Limnocylindrales bacterium]